MSVLPGTAAAKSLYVNKDINAGSPIRAYDIQSVPTYLFFQMDSSSTRYGGAGLAIDTDSEILFVTFETSGTLDIVNAKTLGLLGQVTAPGASNLAGIVVDEGKQKVYTMDRSTSKLYVYSWDATYKTLTNDITTSPYYVTLPGVSQAHGLALDEVNGLLYVGDLTKLVRIFNTTGWTPAGSFSVSQDVQGIAVDVSSGFVYTGNSYPGYGSTGLLCKYDLNTNTETTVNIRPLTGYTSDNVVGLAVDPDTSLLYITTGHQSSGGSDCLMIFDSNLIFLYKTGDIGNPTGIAIPGAEISYNPLNLEKTDDVDPVAVGSSITYTITYDNGANNYAVNNVEIVDTLPAEVSFGSATGGGVYDTVTHTVTWDIGTLAAGDPGGSLTVMVTVTSGAGTTIDNSVTIDSDETPPTTKHEYTDISANQPPVALCQDVTVEAGPGCEADASIDGGSFDPDGDPIMITQDPAGPYPLGDTLVTLTVNDGLADDTCTATVTVEDTMPPVIAVAAVEPQLVEVLGTVNFDGVVGDECDPTVEWDFGDGETSAEIDTTHAYAAPGIYNVTLTVTDSSDNASTEGFIVVAYDPSGGFVTGGGWIYSDPGAYVPDPTLEGKANFGFVSKYKKGATTPTGNTEFQFHAGDLNFHSSSYEWLVVTGSDYARFKGSGTINGMGDYKFMLWARDSAPDTFRIRIWTEDDGSETVEYDNGSDQAVGGGSIIIHTGKK